MIVPTSRPIAVRSAAPPPVAPPPEPALEGTLFDDKALMDNASSRYRAAAEAQRRADELLRKEQEAVARGAKNKNADPFAHLKEEFAELIHDLYGSQNDTAMAAVGAMSSERAKESCYVLPARSRAPLTRAVCTCGHVAGAGVEEKAVVRQHVGQPHHAYGTTTTWQRSLRSLHPADRSK